MNLLHEPVTQYSSHVAGTQPSLVTDNQSVNRLVNTRGNAPLPKAPTFDGTGWKGFIHQGPYSQRFLFLELVLFLELSFFLEKL